MARKVMISVRLAPEIRAAIEKAAADDHRPMSQWIEKVLFDRLQADGYLPAPKK